MSELPPPDPTPGQRAGVWTSEFWMSLATIGAYVALCLNGQQEAAYGLLGIQGTYTLGRSWVRGKVANAG